MDASKNTLRQIAITSTASEPRLPAEDCLTIPYQDNQLLLLESWEQGLRCWIKQPQTQSIRRFCFPKKLFESDGLQANQKLMAWLMILDNMTLKSNQPLSCTITFIDISTLEALLDQFQALLMVIPENIRQIAAEFGDLQYVALECMRHVNGFEAFLSQEKRHGDFSYVMTVWRLLAIENQPVAMRSYWANALMTEPRTQVLSRLLDLPCPHRFLTVLSRLDAQKITSNSVWQLYEGLTDPATAQSLCMCRTLTIEALPELLSIPKWMISPGLFQVLGDQLSEDCPMDSIIPPSILNAPESVRTRIQGSFRKATDLDALENRIHHWADRLFDDVEFPTPPCMGLPGLLEPITNGLALRREGREMRHCVAGYAEQVVTGSTYFYRWLGAKRATVQLSRTAEGQWQLYEYLGYRNRRLDHAEKNEIILALAKAFNSPGLFIGRCKIAGTQYYDFDQVVTQLCHGQPLQLRAQPDNPHDPRAVEVLTENNQKLGYVPRLHNARAFAWLMRGLPVAAKLVQIHGYWWIEMYVADATDDIPDCLTDAQMVTVLVPKMNVEVLALRGMNNEIFYGLAS